MKTRTRHYWTPTEVAQRLLVSPVTVRTWARCGDLKAATTPGGHRRFLRADVEAFARQRGLALQPHEDGTTRVLVVDDDRLVGESLAAALEEVSPAVSVELAFDGFEAGRMVQALEPHVVILDLVMPGLDGYAVCKRLKADPATKGVRVIAVTAHHTPENEARILEAGAEACLRKPVELTELAELIGLQGQVQSL